jgi:hypothetical protein
LVPEGEVVHLERGSRFEGSRRAKIRFGVLPNPRRITETLHRRKGLVARWATAAADTDEIVNTIVRLLAALAGADDRSISAQGAPAHLMLLRVNTPCGPFSEQRNPRPCQVPWKVW